MRKISKEVTLLDVITCTLAMLAPLSNHNLKLLQKLSHLEPQHQS